jgi:hypothetical protein
MRLSDTTTLFFIAGATPTAGELALIEGIEGTVHVRSALKDADYSNGTLLEAADYVAGSPPADYLAAYPFVKAIYPTVGTINAVGDSRSNGTITVTADDYYAEANYPLTWAITHAGGRARIVSADDLGVGGDDTADVLARIATIVADPAESFFLLAGANDRGSSDLTYAQSVSNMEAILDAMGAAGKRVFLANELPYEALTGTQLANHLAFHRWLGDPNGALYQRPYVFPVDTWGAVADDTNENEFRTGDDVDGLHLAVIGAERIGRVLGAALRAALNSVSPFILDAAGTDSFDATTNPGGNLTPNPTMSGTGGSGGTGSSGDFADDFSVSLTSTAANLTVVGSKETDSAGKEWQVLTIGGTPDSDSGRVEFRNELDLSEFSEGDRYEVAALVQWEDLVNMGGLWVETYIDDGPTTYRSRSNDPYNYTRPFPTNSKGTVMLISPQSFVVPAGTMDNIRAVVNIMSGQGAVASSGVIKIADITARKVS